MASQDQSNIVSSALAKGRFILVCAFFLSFLYNLLRLSGPLFMLLIYDRVLTSRSQETLVSLFILVAIFLIVMGLFDYSRRRILARFAAQFQERVEAQIFSSTTKDQFFVRAQNKPTSGLTELDSLRGFFHSGGLIAVFDFIWAPMFLAVVFVLHWILGWVVISGLCVLLLINLIKMGFAKSREEGSQNATARIGDLKTMMVISKDTIRSQEMTSAFKQRWITARQHSRDTAIEGKDWSAWFTILSRQLRMLLQYTVLAVGAYLTLQGQLTVGAMVACTFLVVRVLLPVERFLLELPNISKAIDNWKNLKRIVSNKNPPRPNEDLDKLEARLSLNAVSARSPLTNLLILKSIRLDVAPGTILEITGPSGSGKTILAETIIGAWPKTMGTILVGGTNVERLSAQQAGQLFGYVPETVNFVNGTIEENIARLAPEPDREKIYAVAKLAKIHAMITALPNGYQTEIDAANVAFSIGERHQLAFARALYHTPRILVIDEPDLALRRALHGSLKPVLDSYKERGGIVIILSRKATNIAQVSQRWTLAAGQLKPVPHPKNVTKLDIKSGGAASSTVSTLKRV